MIRAQGYNRAFKLEAVKLVTERGISKAANPSGRRVYNPCLIVTRSASGLIPRLRTCVFVCATCVCVIGCQLDGVKTTPAYDVSYDVYDHDGDAPLEFRCRVDDNLPVDELTSVATNSLGQAIVADRHSHRIVVYDDSCARIATIGRQGDGPGEFRQVNRLAVGSSDSLYVLDHGSRQVTVFSWSPSPQFAYSFEYPVLGDYHIIDFVKPDTAGFLFLALERPTGRSTDLGRMTLVWGNHSGGVIAHSLLEVEYDQFLVIVDEKGFESSHLRIPFGRRSIVRVGKSGTFYHAWSESLSFSVYNIDGALESTIRLRHSNRRIPRRAMTDAIEERTIGPLREGAADKLRSANLPTTFPAFSDYVVDDSSRIWVDVHDSPGEPSVWWILNPAAGSFKRAILDEDLRIHSVRYPFVYATRSDHGESGLVVLEEIRP